MTVDRLVALSFWLAGLLHLAISIGAILHALLRKEEPRQTLLWITFIFLLPYLGPIFYFLFGINRVQRRAARIRGNKYRESIAREATWAEFSKQRPGWSSYGRLLHDAIGLGLTSGNAVVPLFGKEEAYPAMLEAIEKAEVSICLSSYIFSGSGIGRTFCEALAAAQGRNVAVHVIIDDAGRRYTWPSAYSVLRKLGVRVARFVPRNPIMRLVTLNLRNHRKLLIIDGKKAFTGGMNIQNLEGKHAILDTHFQVEGPVVSGMMEVFVEDWAFVRRENLEGEAYHPPLEACGPVWAAAVADGPDEDYLKIAAAFQGALERAERRVWIQTPYFLPEANLVSALLLAVFRGLDVRILVPSRNNILLVKWASQSYYARFVSAGCRICEGSGPFDHSKVMLVDDDVVIVGSANWDPRSLVLNFEFNLACFHGDLSRALERHFEAHWLRGMEVTKAAIRDWSFPRRVRNGIARLFVPYI